MLQLSKKKRRKKPKTTISAPILLIDKGPKIVAVLGFDYNKKLIATVEQFEKTGFWSRVVKTKRDPETGQVTLDNNFSISILHRENLPKAKKAALNWFENIKGKLELAQV